MQRLQDPSEINGNNLNNGNSKYLKDKINELATNSENKNIRHPYKGIN
jgi:hypothetical protein